MQYISVVGIHCVFLSMSGGLSYDEKRARFCDWLKENGARYPKIQWPSLDTVGG